jgi:LysR family transcriptional regulator (chromosome initiation inhibitor)
VIEEGSFDAAARRLQITPSAVSQRLKALEQRVGQVLVRGEKPTIPTTSALPLGRVTAQMALLEAEAIAQLRGGDHPATRIALAVNADSMATWFSGVFGNLGDVSGRSGCSSDHYPSEESVSSVRMRRSVFRWVTS